MTLRMKQAIERLRAIPENQQDGVADFLLNELAEDKRWAASTRAHRASLEGLVDRVLADDDNGLQARRRP